MFLKGMIYQMVQVIASDRTGGLVFNKGGHHLSIASFLRHTYRAIPTYYQIEPGNFSTFFIFFVARLAVFPGAERSISSVLLTNVIVRFQDISFRLV